LILAIEVGKSLIVSARKVDEDTDKPIAIAAIATVVGTVAVSMWPIT